MRRKLIFHKENAQLERLFQKQWHLGVARKINHFPAMSRKHLWQMIERGYEVAIITNMEHFMYLNEAIKNYLKHYMKTTPIFKVEKKISRI